MKKKLTMLLASLFLVLGTVWAQDPVLRLTSEEIGTTYPYALTDYDAAKVFALTDLTIAVKVNTPASLSGRKALFCTSDPTQAANTEAMGTNSHYVAYGTSGAAVGYLASCVTGDRFTSGSISASTNGIILVYVLNPTANNFKTYINGTVDMNRNFGDSYEIATPEMVKEDHTNAKIYIGGGVKSDNAAFETFNGTITDVEVYDGVLTAEQVANLFPATSTPETFVPEAGKMYALQESTSGLFLDIQTLGIKDGTRNTNNISLCESPRFIIFEPGATAGTWRMKNINGQYVYYNPENVNTGGHWNPQIGTEGQCHDWIITESNGTITIARESGLFINTDSPSAGAALYCDKATGMQFSYEMFEGKDFTGAGAVGTINVSDINTFGWTTIPAGMGWTIKMDIENPDGVSYNQWGTSIFALGSNAFPEKNGYKGLQFYLQSSGNGGKLNAVFDGGDHQIDNVTYAGNFSAEITYNGANQLQIKTTNASGTVAVNDYTLTNALGEFSQLAYGLPTGINVNNLYIAPLSKSIDYPTAATVSSGKYSFTSNKILYEGECNKIRFALTESGATYKGGAKRMSFDSFVLNDANGTAVTLKDSYFSGNNTGKVFGNMLDGANGTYCAGAWDSGTEDDWFEVALPNGIDLGGAFSFSFVTENTTMNAKAFNIALSYEAPQDYTFAISGNGDNEVAVTYNENELLAGTVIDIADFDAGLVAATEISGYTWSIVVDDENYTITLVYTEAPIVENPSAVVDLVGRIGGSGTASKFKFVLDPSMNSKQEVFSINGDNDKVLIKGSTMSALTTGLGWYLQNIAHINIAWNSLNEKTVSGAAYADLSDIPVPTTEEIHTSDAKYRYYLNTCTFGYSMTSWTWKRWQQEIDWMALHGINMPLQLVGLEEVWRTFLTMEKADGTRKYGYTDEEAKAFVAGPAFIAWWAMNNLEGWGGTGSGTKSGGTWEGAGGVQDDAWYARQKNLAKQIVDAQRALGMQPVLPGWSGMVPTNFASKSGYATRGNGGNWAGDFVRPLLLNTNIGADKYAEIAADYYKCLDEVMGESQYYSMDPFHEGGGAGTMEDYEALYAAMEAAKAGSQWVIQQWQWSATQRYSLTAVPAGRLIVLDLFADGSPAFDTYNGYAPQDAVFSTIPNFGGRSGLMGRLQNVTDNYFAYKAKYASIKGIGAAPEAIEQTPVAYDLIFQLPWMNGVKPDVAEWVDNYAIARYGKDNAVVKEAWSLLRQGPLNYGADAIQGPVEDVWAARPNLTANPASYWGKTLNNAIGTYTKARHQMLIDAVYKLLSQKETLALTSSSVYESNYNYDLVEFGGAVMADYAYYLLKGINDAKTAAGANFATDPTYIARRDAFLQLILDVDAFKGTNLNFRLGKWTQEARDAASEVTGATTATPDWYEYNNARTIVSTWSSPNTNLNDYSYRSWQGLMKDLYYPRWKHYFDNNCTSAEYGYFEWNWAHGKEHYVGQTAVSSVALTEGQAGHTSTYTREPEGNTVEKAIEILGKYIIPVSVNGSTYYAYRYLTNDLSNKVTIIAMGGGTIDLTKYFGALEGATVTGDFIDGGSTTDFANIAVKSELTEEAYTGTITLADGTVLTFAVSLNPDYYGVYRIKREGKPVFIGYHDWNISNDKDNGGVIGYKLLDPNGGKYTATATADEFITIVPSGSGYSISAQGQYLMSPTYSAWNHLLFSENKGDAGVYVFEETTTADLFKFKSPTSGDDPINYVNSYGNAFGNDKSGKSGLSTFTVEQVTAYPLTITSAGMATLCLPFNVVLPTGMVAYDLVVDDIDEDAADGEADGVYVCSLQPIAEAGETLKAGTPVIVKADAGSYDLAITMEDTDAKRSLDGSLLRGNFVSQNLVQGDETKKFIFANGDYGVGFYMMDAEGPMKANKCWMEWTIPAGASVRSLVLRFGNDATDVEMTTVNRQQSTVIYNLAGQRIATPQKGINIINGRKVVIK